MRVTPGYLFPHFTVSDLPAPAQPSDSVSKKSPNLREHCVNQSSLAAFERIPPLGPRSSSPARPYFPIAIERHTSHTLKSQATLHALPWLTALHMLLRSTGTSRRLSRHVDETKQAFSRLLRLPILFLRSSRTKWQF